MGHQILQLKNGLLSYLINQKMQFHHAIRSYKIDFFMNAWKPDVLAFTKWKVCLKWIAQSQSWAGRKRAPLPGPARLIEVYKTVTKYPFHMASKCLWNWSRHSLSSPDPHPTNIHMRDTIMAYTVLQYW